MDYKINALNQLGLILKGFRKEQRLTQEALAAQLGVSQQAYAQMEADPSSASVERLFRVLRVLGVDLVLAGPADIDSRQQEVLQVSARLQQARQRESGQQAAVIAPQPGQASNKAGGGVKAKRASSVGRREQQALTAPAPVIKKREVW